MLDEYYQLTPWACNHLINLLHDDVKLSVEDEDWPRIRLDLDLAEALQHVCAALERDAATGPADAYFGDDRLFS